MAWTLLRAERSEEAHAIFQALVAEQPDDLQLLSGLGRSAARMGDTAMTCNDPADAPNGSIVCGGTVLVG